MTCYVKYNMQLYCAFLQDHCKDLGPFARSKSSYRADDLVNAALFKAKSPPNLLVRRLQLESLKLQYPDLINQVYIL